MSQNKRSVVWDHFEETDVPSRKKCKSCSKHITFCGSTTSLLRHAKLHQPNISGENIIRANDEKILPYVGDDSSVFPGYICSIKTKYYENSIIITPIMDIAHLPPGGIKNIEACIVFFDSLNKKSFGKIQKYSQFLKSHNIENGILLFNNTISGSDGEITHHDIKLASNFKLDVIELNRLPDQDGDDICGYKEVIQTLSSFLWTNIDIKKGLNPVPSYSQGSQSSEKDVEAELEDFENLFINMQALKSVSSTLNREDVLNRAEKLAMQFVNLMKNDSDDEL